ncbi:MAG: hypothetical protein JSU07_09440 [Bacteroidetes bacterium]|nr:hypothetical protein [Bacteroidota bacterium]
MKKLLFLLILGSNTLFSQLDTLYLKKDHKKIPCKINEITDIDFRYRLDKDGPITYIDKNLVSAFRLASGYYEQVKTDELLVANQLSNVMNRREAVKLHPFSIAFNQLAFAYERVLKVGTNLDAEVGYINSNFNPNYLKIFDNQAAYNPSGYYGFYLKPGIKFLSHGKTTVRGAKFQHPLLGGYVSLNLALSYMQWQGLTNTFYDPSSSSSVTYKSDYNTTAYGCFINFGNQSALGSFITLDYYIGFGYTGQSGSMTFKGFYDNPYNNSSQIGVYPNYGYISQKFEPGNFHGFFRSTALGLSMSMGFRIGFMLPEPKQKAKQFYN